MLAVNLVPGAPPQLVTINRTQARAALARRELSTMVRCEVRDGLCILGALS